MSKEILCTLGPASMNDRVIDRLSGLGVTLFRINLSHTEIADLPGVIRFVQSRTEVPICLDTEGAQIRTGGFVDTTILVRDNSDVTLHSKRVAGDSQNWNLYPGYILQHLRGGDIISIDFNSVLIQVVDVQPDRVRARVLNGGKIGRNKAVTVYRDIPMQPLTEKDIAALKIGMDFGISNFALSFANSGDDAQFIRDIIGPDAYLISKIESLNGLKNLEDILEISDALLIDRGDLSRQVPIEQIPRTQKSIIARAKARSGKVYVATNLLESMVALPHPTRAEVNDIYNTLVDGADGLVLAAETAIGEYPIQCANMIVKMIRTFEQGSDSSYDRQNSTSLLVEPHGGQLVYQRASPDTSHRNGDLQHIAVRETDMLDCRQIAEGTYSPLTGFMGRDDLNAVLESYRLNDGTVWTLPIILQVPLQVAHQCKVGEHVVLEGPDGNGLALIDIEDIYQIDLEEVAKKWFGTASTEHPGVARLYEGGEQVLAGPVTMLEDPKSVQNHFVLAPSETRNIFDHKGWTKVVAFHTRNAVHRVHEYIIRESLARSGADGVYINPVIGMKKPGDFLPGPIMQSYQTTLDFGYLPRDKVVLGSFATYSRYAGPREAVFTALCRKNMGCSHFIIGRDHTGVGDYYAPTANRDLFDRLGDIGITPVFFDAFGFDPETNEYSTLSPSTKQISGTQVRERLQSGEEIPDWLMRDVVQDLLREEIRAGHDVFVDT